MFKNLTYRKKNKWLVVGLILFAFFSYKMACQQMMSIDHVLGTSQRADTNVQQQLLGIVTDYCQKRDVVLREFPKTIQKTQEDYLVETNIFTVEGDFIKLLELVYLLEQKSRIGKIASVNFLSKKDFKTKSLALTATIYLQNVKKVSK